ncbi:hypothetical protein [Clostridium sp.]|uniref:hypothetical protein n=1 Tax=Clostridium sp. TaxID=1506 RepID=UPI0032178E72
MEVTTQDILEKIDKEFTIKYKPFSKFKNSGQLWDMCINLVKNPDLLNKLIFANDILNIPPVEVFVSINNTISEITDYDKKALGAFWGFVFKFVFEYRNQRSKCITTKAIRTATYFYDRPNQIVVKGDGFYA